MSDIAELEGRISAALERIGRGVEELARPMPAAEPEAPDTSEVDALQEALEAEKIVNAQLEERVRAIKEKQETTVEMLASEVDRLRGLLEREEAGLAKLRKANAALRSNNLALREAVAQGVSEPHLVNKAMMAELEALRAAQAADRAELDAVLGELAPVVAGAAALGADADEAGAGREEGADA